MQQKNPYLPLTLGVVAVSFAAIFIKLSSAPSLIIASYRMLFAFICLLPVVLWRYRSELVRISPRNRGLMLLSGLFLAAHFACWITSFRFTTVASSTALVSTQPIFAVVFSYLLFKEKVTRRQLVAVVIAIVGSIIIGLADAGKGLGSASLWGDTLALLGAVFAAGYFLCGRAVRKDVAVLPYAVGVYGISALALLATSVASHAPLYPYSPRDFLLFLGLAIVCTVIGHSVLNWSLAYLPAAAVGVAVLGEPIGASFWAVVLFNEIPSNGQLLGGSLLLIGILLFMLQPAAARSISKPS